MQPPPLSPPGPPSASMGVEGSGAVSGFEKAVKRAKKESIDFVKRLGLGETSASTELSDNLNGHVRLYYSTQFIFGSGTSDVTSQARLANVHVSWHMAYARLLNRFRVSG
ncbi:hypothetical protein BGY98DRAFT_936970 [Russula aff. rugulosa BPL654]|nr:hypothetical protein BGY98DRAFT_936970 [Russula aff. rugulosa BPL654]